MKNQVKKDDYKLLFKTFTIKHEFFTHIVPVPAAIYYSIITLQKFDSLTMWSLIISGVTSATILLILGTIVRYLHLKKIFSHLIPAENYQIKKELLFLPYFEAILIMIRWIIGVIQAHVFLALALKYFTNEFDWRNHITSIPLILFIIPIEMSGHFLITENEIRKYFQTNVLKTLTITEKHKHINIFLQILFFIFSLVNMPIILFLSMNYLSTENFHLKNIIIHMIAITLILLYPLLHISYYIAKKIRINIQQIKKSLEEVSKSNFDEKLGMLSYDEFGELAIYINKIIDKLKELYYSLVYLNKNLEKKVEERTRELQESLQKIQELKTQQDADYFLTTLLLKPFVNSYINNNKINQALEYDFFIKQKKEFSFKKTSGEIGGDYCCFDEIHLKNKPYLFFINADAMGKSIQGAGGILVLGSMIQSALQRNKFFKEDQMLSPEHWLRELFIQIHKTLETFQGTMFITAVLGLIDVESQSLYYMNADHPSPVLVRNREAFYLNPQNNLSKLGLTIGKKSLFVHTYQLQQEDILFIGSDGKDDIELPDGTMNDNEFFFLDLLNQSNYTLNDIYKLIQLKGKIKDDLSLLKIEVLEKPSIENEELMIRKKEILNLIAKNHLNKEIYEKIFQELKYYINLISLDNISICTNCL
jgi:serine phosphatase RsbU (regulator of sigma subunit)